MPPTVTIATETTDQIEAGDGEQRRGESKPAGGVLASGREEHPKPDRDRQHAVVRSTRLLSQPAATNAGSQTKYEARLNSSVCDISFVNLYQYTLIKMLDRAFPSAFSALTNNSVLAGRSNTAVLLETR